MAISLRPRRRVRVTPPVRFAWIILTPFLLSLVIFTGIPLVMAFVQSLQHGDLITSDRPFVGLANYQYALTQDPVFFTTLSNTLFYTVVTVLLGNTFSFGLALLISHIRRFVGVFRLLFYLPGITTAVAVASVWKALYDVNAGVFNQILRSFGLVGPDWLGDTHLALLSVTTMSIWWGIGGGMLIYLAGLQGVDTSLYEAARVDGARGWPIFWYITLPQMQPMLIFQGIIGTIAGMQVFVPMFVLTNGGPIDATRSIVEYMIDNGLGQGNGSIDIGYAAAISFILFALVFVLVMLEFWLARKGERDV
ncbi:carbohydrate ABC transporter permease [Dictyobacter kobayashii]|uniref:Sugar ABC transporter permease n=1 Tax=Dictyobacter kobayashii TaxID=2014872 RepID=A0A402ATZ5_9CHLR|nr:sugar ABC transporter permease [Dictyobacter kobayashii]GCE22503.1 sugar ABC transporter permease [Dictyobacter kobayashii]